MNYRPGIIAVFQDTKGRVLLFKRSGMDAWQFPQGGIDAGESPQEALFREVREETGNGNFRIIAEAGQPVPYEFPPAMDTSLSRRYRGQLQHWFLCEFLPGSGPDLSQALDDEFEDFRWADLREVISGIVDWKQKAYQQGMKLLGLDI